MSIDIDYAILIDKIFKKHIKTENATGMYHFLCDLYYYDPSRFSFCNPIHQNSYDDPLHFSLRVTISTDLYYTLHINGFLKTRFIINNISIKMGAETGTPHIETIVKFVNY